ncbi:helix-turn-helix domain-containing protein [Amycolatopsis roodepoortensis]|uniref:Transcriptional regulator with XRE-family HTH domain n=1 Tax=Amycolatopsis roodepoortensis TaxID=700274 RepID=A0ABR9LL66_9PSEU|nr:helix-turn-helix transcriptional regulator [Amycolatopsis roodepoortensis]MBE1581405.1 transcriptional regulator with XRE-family HTH domain [Amycolatopsis roodepoortensis]
MPKPTPQARALADGLRAARKAVRLAATEVADKLAWSQSTISRIETGLRAASAEEVSALLAVYQVTGERREALLSLSRDPGAWWFGDVSLQGETLARYEKEATKIVAFGTTLLPGLLRTPAYARAANSPAAVLGQKRFVAYIDEAALHRQVGGPLVMANQLRHLVSMAERPTVELRVIPFAAGAHAGDAHVLLEFGDAPPVVYLEHRRCGLFLHRPCDVEPYLRSTVDAVALDPARSVRLIESVIEARPQRGDLLGQ